MRTGPSSLFKKGLLLALLPLSVNLLWIVLFWCSLQHCLFLVNTVRQDSNVIVLMSRGIAHATACIFDAAEYIRLAGNAAVKNKAKQDGLSLLATLHQLSEATRGDTVIGPLTARLSQSTASFEGEIRDMAAVPNPLTLDFHRLMPQTRLLPIFQDATELLEVMHERDQRLNKTLEVEEMERSRIKLITLTGFALNVLLCIAMVFYFQRSIARRIHALSSRSRMLPAGQYEKGIGGHDELNLLEDELWKANQQLQAARQFKQSFMTIMAEKLSTRLLECISLSKTLDKETILGNQAGLRRLQGLRSSASTCLNLINDALLFESMQGGTLPIDLHTSNIKLVADEAIALVFNLTSNKNISVVNQVESRLLQFDSARIKQVLVNLLANAIKFSPQDGIVTLGSSLKGGLLHVFVTDTGPGMNRDVQARLFEKFFQSREGKRAGGTGLGLAIARLIVEAHHGSIGVESQPGQGSTFWFALPLHLTAEG
jgi:signal transduction histidine kinase